MSTPRVATIRHVLLTTAFMGAATMAVAQTAAPFEPTPEAGLAVANRFCTNCHLTGATTSSSVPAGPPSFSAIANKPDQTAERLVGMMINPHPPMPDVQLTREEILNLLAYIESLRKTSLPAIRTPGVDPLPRPQRPTGQG